MVPPPTSSHPLPSSISSPEVASNDIRTQFGTQAWVNLFLDEQLRAGLGHILGAPGYGQWVKRCLEPHMARDHERDEDEDLSEGDEEFLNLSESRPDQRTNFNRITFILMLPPMVGAQPPMYSAQPPRYRVQPQTYSVQLPGHSLFRPVHNFRVPVQPIPNNFVRMSGPLPLPPPPPPSQIPPFHSPAFPFTLRRYNSKLSLVCHIIAFIRIIFESYFSTYHQIRCSFRRGNSIVFMIPRMYTRPSLMEYIVGGPGMQPNLIRFSVFQTWGIQFPDISTPPPIPRSLQLVPRPWRSGRPENQREGSGMASSANRAPFQGAGRAVRNRVRRSEGGHGRNRKRARKH